MDKDLLKKIPFIAGVGLAFLDGLLFTLLGDLAVYGGSPWLIGGVLLTFGGVVCLFLSENFRERKIVMWILKALALAMIVSFIGYAVAFHDAMALSIKKKEILANNTPVMIVLLVFSGLSVAAQIVDIVFAAKFKEE